VEIEKIEMEVEAQKEANKRGEIKKLLLEKKLRLTELQCQKTQLEIIQLKTTLGLQPISLEEYTCDAPQNTG
jgi:hypothetical protein